MIVYFKFIIFRRKTLKILKRESQKRMVRAVRIKRMGRVVRRTVSMREREVRMEERGPRREEKLERIWLTLKLLIRFVSNKNLFSNIVTIS